MTLGRTAEGAIKIKTDGGLRAVECACCDSLSYMLPLYKRINLDGGQELLPTSGLPDVYVDPAPDVSGVAEDYYFTYKYEFTAVTFSDLENVPTWNNGTDSFLSFAVQTESTFLEEFKPSGVYARSAIGEPWIFTGKCPRRSAGKIVLQRTHTFSNKVAIPCSATACWNPTGAPDNDPPIPPFCECNGLYWDGNAYVENPNGAYAQLQEEVMSVNTIIFDYTSSQFTQFQSPLNDLPRTILVNSLGFTPFSFGWHDFYRTNPKFETYFSSNSNYLGFFIWSDSFGAIGGCATGGSIKYDCVANFNETVDYVTIPFPRN
jgi:hypothetical protein